MALAELRVCPTSPAGAALASGAAVALPAARCAHCGDSLFDLKVVRRKIEGCDRSFCCLGCAFIAEQLASTRWVDAPVSKAADDPSPAVALRNVQIPIEGMVCGACALLIEHRLRRAPGVASAQVDFAGRRAYLAFDPARYSEAAAQATIQRTGYRVGAAESQRAGPRRVELLRVLIAWLVMMQVMMLAVPAYLAEPGDITRDVEQLLRIAQLILTVPVMFCAWPLVRAAMSQVRARAIGMDLPIVIGLAAAFVASVYATMRATGPVYFDSITMFVALVLGLRWLQARWLMHAQALVDAAQRRNQLWAQRLRAFPASIAGDRVPASQLVPEDHVLVAAGETVPADGRVAQGATTVSQAWLTGESTPLDVHSGDQIAAGCINLQQPIVVRVERAGDATSLAALHRLVDEASRGRPPVVELANRVAVWFLWAVLVITAATVVGWSMIDPSQALPNAIAVLVATCPCALSLAAPAAFTAMQSALARRGILTVRTAALERLAAVDTLVCDKTGTLTLDAPTLIRIVPLCGDDPEALLARAAALESLTTHPFARALTDAARQRVLSLPTVIEGEVAHSLGVEATIDGTRMRIGRADYATGLMSPGAVDTAALQRRIASESNGTGSVVVLGDAHDVQALFVFGETLRAGARELVEEATEAGIDVALLSGDRRAQVVQLAGEVGLDDARVLPMQTPESKRRYVQGLQSQGKVVAMLGDGLNDAPVIAQADVAIALATGSSLAQTRADFIVVSSRLDGVAAALHAARRGLHIVRTNLGWALGYNVLAIPLAAFGFLTPALAALGMAASSALVLANAARARRL